MKRGIKCICSLLVMMLVVFGASTDFLADTKEDVSVEISTDKEVYENKDEVLVTVKVTNNSEDELSDLNVKMVWPEGVVAGKDSEDIIVVDVLAAGESKTFEIIGKVGGGSMSALFWVVIAIAVVAVVAVIVLVVVKHAKKTAVVSMVLLFTLLWGVVSPMSVNAGEIINVETPVTVNGLETTIGAKITYSVYYLSRLARVSVHDPSIVYDEENDMYYIFGSHMAWAKSEDLINWKTFKNNINTDFRKLFANEVKWSANGGTQGNNTYDVAGNLWAPDVVYNEEMGKWTMYMSVNGDRWYSSIVLLTADSLEGDWTYVGPVVYSGFTSKEEAQETDFYDVYTGTDFPDRYNKSSGTTHSYGMNAIDPCVFYDEDGRLWMAYGSWFGGIYMLELDPATGLRLASHTYETKDGVSDEYQGIKIAGGNAVSGEGAYIEHVGDYYYLYISYGGLTAKGGYNMRVYRSENPDGPYVDLTGDSSLAKSGNNNINGEMGVRVMSNYQWDYMNYGYVAQGHNSVFSDDEGRTFLVYHTRFTNQGETHSVRVHQQFLNEDGWLVTAPFDYTGEGFSYVEKEDVVGSYSMLTHILKVNYANLKCAGTKDIELKEDGTISGAVSGTWEFSESLGAPYVTMKIDDVTYKGVFVKQRMDNSGDVTMTFTVLGDNEVNLWGYLKVEE